MDGSQQKTPEWLMFFTIAGIILVPALLLAWLFDGSQASKQAVGAILGLGAVVTFVIVMGYAVYAAIKKAAGRNQEPKDNAKP